MGRCNDCHHMHSPLSASSPCHREIAVYKSSSKSLNRNTPQKTMDIMTRFNIYSHQIMWFSLCLALQTCAGPQATELIHFPTVLLPHQLFLVSLSATQSLCLPSGSFLPPSHSYPLFLNPPKTSLTSKMISLHSNQWHYFQSYHHHHIQITNTFMICIHIQSINQSINSVYTIFSILEILNTTSHQPSLTYV